MADTAQLVVALEARFDRLEKNLRDAGVAAERGVDRIERNFRDANARFERAGSDLGRALVVGIAQGIGQNLAQQLDPRNILSRLQAVATEIERIQRLGEETRLGGGTVRSLEFAGVGAGLQASEIDQALRRFSDVSKKSTEDADTFYRALRNVSAEFERQFRAAATQEERLAILSRAFASTTDEVRRGQLAQEAFGTDSERLSDLLARANGNIDSFRNAARQAGLVIDDAIISRSAAAARELQQFGSVISETVKPALAELLPLLRQLLPYFQQFVQDLGTFANSFVPLQNRAYDALGRQAEQLRDNLRTATDPAAIEGYRRALRGIEGELDRRTNAQNFQDPNRPVVTIRGAAFRPRPSLSSSGGGDDETDRDAEAFQRAIQQVERRTVAQNANTQALALNTFEANRNRIEMELMELVRQREIDLTAEQQAAIRRVATAYAEATVQFERAQTAQRQSLELQRFLGQEAVSSISGLISGTAKLSDVVAKLANRLAEAALQAAFLGDGPLAGLLGTASPQRGSVGGLIGALFRGLIPGRASGGPVSGNQPYVVGEDGPELFVPGRSGYVVPNGASAGGGAPQVSLSMVNDFRGADPGSEARIMSRLDRLEAGIPSIVVKTVQHARDARILR